MKSFRDIRVIPVVLIAIFALAVLKVAGLVIEGGYVVAYQPQTAARSWAQETFNFPTGKNDRMDITGSIQEKPKEETAKAEAANVEAAKAAVAAPEAARPEGTNANREPRPAAKAQGPGGRTASGERSPPVSPSERAILERLQSRRQELEARAREIDIRESLLKAAEKRIESRVEELKAVESRIGTASEQKSEADVARFKGIVTMYEGMKPKDAAKVFDRAGR